MWWNRMIFGLEGYHVILWFITYSMLGWLVESMYMSVCNRKLTNRGFAKGPYCPIYGVGALTVFFILRPYADNAILLFFMGSALATSIEIVTAVIMKRMFGGIWWDYADKPFNYRGVICLESSIAWGFYTIFLFLFLQNIVTAMVNVVPVLIGRTIGSVLLVIFAADFLNVLYKEKKDSIPDQVVEWKDTIIEKIYR